MPVPSCLLSGWLNFPFALKQSSIAGYPEIRRRHPPAVDLVDVLPERPAEVRRRKTSRGIRPRSMPPQSATIEQPPAARSRRCRTPHRISRSAS
jgi:hypothetical protein